MTTEDESRTVRFTADAEAFGDSQLMGFVMAALEYHDWRIAPDDVYEFEITVRRKKPVAVAVPST